MMRSTTLVIWLFDQHTGRERDAGERRGFGAPSLTDWLIYSCSAGVLGLGVRCRVCLLRC